MGRDGAIVWQTQYSWFKPVNKPILLVNKTKSQMRPNTLLSAIGLLATNVLASFHLPFSEGIHGLESIEHDPECPFYETNRVAQGVLDLNPVFQDSIQDIDDADKVVIPNECPCTWCRACPGGIIIPKPGVNYRMICYSTTELTDNANYPGGFTGCSNGGNPYWLKLQTDDLADRKCWKKIGLVDCQRLHPGSIKVIKNWVLNCVSWAETGFKDANLGNLVCINVLA